MVNSEEEAFAGPKEELEFKDLWFEHGFKSWP